MQSLRASLLAKLYGKSHQLKTLSDVMQANFQNKKYMGFQNISVTRIVGTISRNDDFDEFFRPRKKHLRNRWINIFLLDSDYWPPIVVHQIGDDYFVEDGHHRVSVARSKGIMFIEAEVWDHSGQAVQRSPGVPPCLRAKILIKSCVAD
jgi:hypothetical protein